MLFYVWMLIVVFSMLIPPILLVLPARLRFWAWNLLPVLLFVEAGMALAVHYHLLSAVFPYHQWILEWAKFEAYGLCITTVVALLINLFFRTFLGERIIRNLRTCFLVSVMELLILVVSVGFAYGLRVVHPDI
ncbi:hypothetical protein HHS34_005305 [Acidithiobacillus montserratensis]|uniref:Uncharacterized protein n=1 Tax=Acidithiobacillus montserratensis TaxID=2729135 RepID=A0ACD5HIL4_9PROT|nr:hypothetical protein [Acidithiobacillus montserratensis]MBU2746583.1 hypothetical protein [Acidithiobacillus montserratensis]